MSDWQPGSRWSRMDHGAQSWQRQAQDDLQSPGASSAYPPANRGRGHKRGSSSREPHPGGQHRSRAALRPREEVAHTVPPPPMPTRPTPRILPSYSQVDSFDDVQAPWSRERTAGDLDFAIAVSQCCHGRWFHYGRKFTPQGINGWRPSQSGQN